MAIQTINPTTGAVEKTYKIDTDEQIEKKLNLAVSTFKKWRKTSFAERRELFEKLVAHIEKNKEKYAKLNTTEMGKPIKQSIGELEKCAKG